MHGTLGRVAVGSGEQPRKNKIFRLIDIIMMAAGALNALLFLTVGLGMVHTLEAYTLPSASFSSWTFVIIGTLLIAWTGNTVLEKMREARMRLTAE